MEENKKIKLFAAYKVEGGVSDLDIYMGKMANPDKDILSRMLTVIITKYLPLNGFTQEEIDEVIRSACDTKYYEEKL